MYRIYIVEDDAGIAAAIAQQARMWNYDVRIAEDFRNIAGEFQAYQPHIVLMDISLPFFDGYHGCAELRKQTKVPILFISSASANMNIVMAINMGADDFIAKPFDQSVLMAKVQALLRRSYDFTAEPPDPQVRGAVLSASESRLSYNGQEIDLTKNECRILSCLMESAGRVVSREKLMQRLWETDCFVDENTLTVNINRLRKKLDGAGLTQFIATRHGVGYIIEV